MNNYRMHAMFEISSNKILPLRWIISLNKGFAVKTARPKLSSLLIGNRSPSFGSV